LDLISLDRKRAMTFSHRIAIRDNKSAKQNAAIMNQRRMHNMKWLRKQENKKKSISTKVQDNG
jgi:hypothetical protein